MSAGRLKGHIVSEETRLKISLTNIGKSAWNKGLPGRKHTEEEKRRISERHRGNTYSVGRTPPNKGIPHSEKTKAKMRAAQQKRIAEGRHNNYFTDRTKLKPRPHYPSVRYYWTQAVYKRDNFKCRIANADCSGRIEAHHILRWSEYPELRFEVRNGITLCHAHHPFKPEEEHRLQSEFQALVAAPQ